MLLRNNKRDSKKGDKMQPRWIGPYRVHINLGKGVYKLKNMKGAILKAAVNQHRLKRYQVCSNDLVCYCMDIAYYCIMTYVTCSHVY